MHSPKKHSTHCFDFSANGSQRIRGRCESLRNSGAFEPYGTKRRRDGTKPAVVFLVCFLWRRSVGADGLIVQARICSISQEERGTHGVFSAIESCAKS